MSQEEDDTEDPNIDAPNLLPILTQGSITIYDPNYEVEKIPDLTQLKKEALVATSNSLNALHFCWGQAKGIFDICKLATTTAQVLKERRLLMCEEYGPKREAPGKNTFFPID